MTNLKALLPANVFDQLEEIKRFEIDTPLRISHFLAQCAHESANFELVEENLNYSESGLLKVFGKYFKPDTAKTYARKPEMIANRVYANRMGNGPESSGDGWKYRGRGYIQLTGKDNYKMFDSRVDANIVGNPDLVADVYPLLSAAWFWYIKGINVHADLNNIERVTRKVNGGLNGLEDRKNTL